MDAYSRYTAFGLDEDDRERVLAFWQDVGVPSASAQPGFRLAAILESEETPGRLRTITVWDRREDFDAYDASDDHRVLSAAMTASGLRVEERDDLRALHVVDAPVGHLRVTEAELPPAAVERARTYWRQEGRALLLRQPGCLRAEAYIAGDPARLVVAIAWRTEADADAFRAHPDHHAFGAGLGADVVPVARTAANPL